MKLKVSSSFSFSLLNVLLSHIFYGVGQVGVKDMIEKLLAVLAGSTLLGLGIDGFLVPYHLLDGGIIGLGLIVHYFYGWPTGMSIIFLSIPLYALAWFFERRYFYYSLHGLIVSSFCIDLFSFMNGKIQLGILPSTIIGGLIVGIGVGLMLRYETSTGGTDLLAQLITKITSINVGIVIFIIDAIVVIGGVKVIGWENFLYSFLTIFCVGLMTAVTSSVEAETE
jgi:uncharacterized membrane-anchored protein YitT (DUF2179 family)